ncbi:MAG: hypothetical protein CTY15_05245 [Methylocystis sp.]|nr:MAG: hypothetical protein CTY15_05245 [Methylocystis sp.]
MSEAFIARRADLLHKSMRLTKDEAAKSEESMSKERIVEGVRFPNAALARLRSRKSGVAAYARLCDAAPERRSEARRAARLRWGKTLDCAERFLSDCLIADRTSVGARLKLARNIGVPQRFQLFEDESGDLFAARVIWRRGSEIGCRLSAAGGNARIVQRMRSRCYAL